MSVDDIESRAGAQAASLLETIESKHRGNIAKWVARKSSEELSWLVLALANSYLRLEAERDEFERRNMILGRENDMFNTANEALFTERNKLTERVSELRGILYNREEKRAA